MTPRFVLSALADLDTHGFDAVIDARSPAEFAEAHLPGTINLPVLDDVERARVGTLYKSSRFEARRLGAALIARNVAAHLEGALAERPARFRPLVYCWRGGQRSGAFALILGQIGWQVSVLEGGWRAWRRLVVQALYDAPFPAPIWLLDGNTGSAKTELLAQVAGLGGQVIDLEALARHRGSVFGLKPGDAQPSQKAFEGALAMAMARLDPTRPVLIEAESNLIGRLRLPPALWQAMQGAPRIEIRAPLAERARYIAQDYAALAADSGALAERLGALAPFHPRARIASWQALAASGETEALATSLMAEHYDPRYARQRKRQPAPLRVLETASLDKGAIMALAHGLQDMLG
ncbi:MAG: tRNA 2-selenouridine(34) synthase MnmH [Pararhodobacter sp.]|nr:tRNA 2-selenouridine(34) synthase MnmH [Pararhodobacter sp.]